VALSETVAAEGDAQIAQDSGHTQLAAAVQSNPACNTWQITELTQTARKRPASLHACGIAASNAAASGLQRACNRALVDCSTVFV